VAYRVELLRTAAREFERLPTDVKAPVRRALVGLREGGPPTGARKLAGGHEFYRIRVRGYRILYEVRDRDQLVLVIRIGHRRDVYR
jgi:mRNA interferase RelE/StbE